MYRCRYCRQQVHDCAHCNCKEAQAAREATEERERTEKIKASVVVEGVELIAACFYVKCGFVHMQLPLVEIWRMNSPFYEGEKWRVANAGSVLNRKGKWEHEPLPSSRTDAFYRRCRFDSIEEAVSALKESWGG